MATGSTTVAQVLDKAAALMNDAAKTSFTNAAMLPYFNIALDELQESFAQNNIPVTNSGTSPAITIPIGTKLIGPQDGIGASLPALPADFVQAQALYERLAGSADPFVPMTRREFLPHALDDLATEALQYWTYEGQQIRFVGATTTREIKIDYIKSLFPNGLTASDPLGLINCNSFLYYRTAALCSHFIGENETRAGQLNGFAELAINRVITLNVKGKQSIQTRRRPFMGAYKRRSFT